MGAEHMHIDYAMAIQWLRSEAASLQRDLLPVNEAPYEVVSPDGSVVRVNLRPYLARGGNLDSLARVFVETTVLVARDTTRLVAYWREVEQLGAANRIPFTPDSVRGVLSAARAKGFPAPGHSVGYRAAYRPAYRVVHRSLLRRIGLEP